jgi:hypothetical protein
MLLARFSFLLFQLCPARFLSCCHFCPSGNREPPARTSQTTWAAPSASMVTAQSFEHRDRLVKLFHLPLCVVSFLPQILQHSTEIGHIVLSYGAVSPRDIYISYSPVHLHLCTVFFAALAPPGLFLGSPGANFVCLELQLTLTYTARQIVENLSCAMLGIYK